MPIFKSSWPDVETGLSCLHAVKQLIFCVGQSREAIQELDQATLCSLGALIERIGSEIETAFDTDRPGT